jgi:hypothetical protein
LPWVWNLIDGLDEISKFALCTNAWFHVQQSNITTTKTI